MVPGGATLNVHCTCGRVALLASASGAGVELGEGGTATAALQVKAWGTETWVGGRKAKGTPKPCTVAHGERLGEIKHRAEQHRGTGQG